MFDDLPHNLEIIWNWVTFLEIWNSRIFLFLGLLAVVSVLMFVAGKVLRIFACVLDWIASKRATNSMPPGATTLEPKDKRPMQNPYSE